MSGEFEDHNAGASAAVKTTLGLLPVIALSAALTTPSYAQQQRPQAQQAEQGVTELETITVEGGEGTDPRTSYKKDRVQSQKTTTALLDTPKTVEIITQKVIEERAVSNVLDVLRTTPGVTLGTGEGGTPLGDRPYVRGFEASMDMSIDGVRNLGRASYDAFNVESVEVHKGADSVFSGRGAAGGSINMSSKAPIEGETFHDFSGMIGTGNQKRATYDGNYSSAAFDARLNLLVQDSDVPGRDITTEKRYGFAPSVTAHLGEASKLTLSYYHLTTDGIPDYGVPFANAASMGFGSGTKADPYRPIESIRRNNFYGSALRDFRKSRTNVASARFEHEFTDNFRMQSQLSYNGNYQDYVISRPGLASATTVSRAMRGYVRDNDTLALTTNFNSEVETGSLKHNLAFGFEASREVLNTASYSGGNIPAANNLSNPTPWSPMNSALTLGSFSETSTNTTSAYLFDNIEFNDQWMLNLGGRVDRYEVENSSSSRSDTMFNYQAGLVYKPLPNGSIYISHATSSSPAGFCAGLAGGSGGSCDLDAATAETKPERTYNYQLGTKWDLLNGDLSLTGAIFQTQKVNQRVQDLSGDYELVGESRARGFEVGISGKVTTQWSVSAGYTYVDARLVDDGAAAGNDGNKLLNTAAHTFGLWSTYDFSEKLTLGGGANYVSQKYTNAQNTAAVPAYWKVDLMASYAFNDQAKLQLNVNNVFDERIYDSGHNGLFATLQPGRNATLKFNYKF